MASVTPRRNRNGTVTWRVQFRIEGAMVQESFADDNAAHKFAQLVDRVGGAAARKARQARNDSQTATLTEFTAKYLDPSSGLLSGVTPGTRDGYRQIAERSFLPILGPYPIDTISKQDVAAWVSWQEDQPSTRYRDRKVSAKTIRNYHGLLSAILTAAVEQKLADENAARGTSLTSGIRQGVTFLTGEQFEVLMHFIPTHYKPLTLWLAGTGMRWGEATAITWADLDTSRVPAMLSIDKAWKKGAKNRAVLGPPKTSKGTRTISVWPELLAVLSERKAGGELVFMGLEQKGRVWSHRFHESAWIPALKSANDPKKCAELGLIPIGKTPRVHDLRHSHASWLIAAGVPLPYIQHRLGHENITTTVDLYGHMLPDMQNVPVRVMTDVMKNVLPTIPAVDVVLAELL